MAVNLEDFSQGLQQALQGQLQLEEHSHLDKNDLLSVFHESWEDLSKETRQFLRAAVGSYLLTALPVIRQEAIQAGESDA